MATKPLHAWNVTLLYFVSPERLLIKATNEQLKNKKKTKRENLIGRALIKK